MNSVLLVEDNATNQEVASMLLEDIGLTVLIADDGQKAIDVLNGEHDIKLVFMDCQMPNMDGYTATREIRKGAAGTANAEIPIVAMTANALAGDREKCLQAGMNDYITKPISFLALEQMVEQWMSV